ncbi:hypothetical protein [Aestuariibaculum marinum]|uniref:Uncharacterized protein n=1 Tax=Aestuariibaculum marinum TaxID=2683592 RepID=A0A8J6PYK3_9FLAO|nr:hypothetical protein [Aestuariibaculum marinum]MBD0822632.1 hypothetical protein [Aestuariibaculum marinum]
MSIFSIFVIMATIFDYNPTPQELKNLFGDLTLSKDTYLSEFDTHAYAWDLCLLFHLRNDSNNLNKVLETLDPLTKQDFYRTVEHT